MQQRQWDAAETELAECRAELAEAQEIEDRADKVAANRAKWGSNQLGGHQTQHGDVSRLSGGDVRSAALRALDSAKHLASTQLDYADSLVRSTAPECNGEVIARYIAMTETPEYRSAFMHVLGDAHPVLTAAEAEALRSVAAFRAASLGDATGGYAVPATLDSAVVLTAQGSANPVAALATRKTITSDVWKGVASDGVAWSWDAEAEEVSDDAPTIGQPIITPHAARGFIPYSIEIGQDWPGFAAEMSRLLAEGFAELLAGAFITGNGTTQPRGILTALDANTTIQVAVTTVGEFSYADIHKVWSALPDRARGGSTWLMNPATASHLAANGDTYGSRTASLDGVPVALRGRPVAESGKMAAFAAATTAQDICVVGDFAKYYIVQRAGMVVENVPHLFGTTNGHPTGQRGLFAWARIGADSVDDGVFRLLNSGS